MQKAAAAAKPSVNVSADELRAAIAKIRSEEIPEIGPEREAYFMQNVGIGEQLCTQGTCNATSITARVANKIAVQALLLPSQLPCHSLGHFASTHHL